MPSNEYFFQSPGPIFLDLNFVQLRWYGLMYAVAFIVCLSLAKKISKESEEELTNFFFVALISGLIGARLWYVILSWDFYSKNLLEIFQIWHGGQSIQGGMLGIIIGCYLFQKENFLSRLSLISTVIPLGQAIGRWGNFFNEEAFGKVTELPWKIYISHTKQFHHPTFLYESLWNLICFFIMLKLFHNKTTPLKLIASYLALYSFGRLLIEPLRTDSLMLWGFPAASVVAVITILIAIMLAVYDYKYSQRNSTNTN